MSTPENKKIWLIKFAPFRTSWEEIVRRGVFRLRGVRSPEARNYLRKMKLGDTVFFARSQRDPALLGLIKVTREAYPDPTSADPRWLTCDFAPVRTFPRPIGLTEARNNPRLQSLPWLLRPRLSVMPILPEHARILMEWEDCHE